MVVHYMIANTETTGEGSHWNSEKFPPENWVLPVLICWMTLPPESCRGFGGASPEHQLLQQAQG